MDGNFGNAMASMSQPRNRLENRGSENDEISGGMWKVVETGTGEIRIGETNRGRSKERSRKEVGGKE